jgi:formate dehydrogenase major subunit
MKEKIRGGVFKSIFIIGEDVYGFDRSNADFVAVADLYMTETAKKADVVYPLVSLYESIGMIVSMDGTINEIPRVLQPRAKSNVAAISIIANAMKSNFDYASSEDVKREIIETNASKIAQIQPTLKTVQSVPLYHNNPNTNGIYFKV